MRDRLIVAAGLGAVAVIAAVAVVVLRFGVSRTSLPSLREAPQLSIPGEIVYASGRHCLTRIAASGAGEPRKVCTGAIDGPELIFWVDETTVSVESRGRTILVNLDTGEATEVGEPSGTAPPPIGLSSPEVAPSGAIAETDVDGRLFILEGSERKQVADLGTKEWRLSVAIWSPDSQWIGLTYWPASSDGGTELWIVSRNGSIRGTLATDLWAPQALSWRIEGVGVTPQVDYPD